MVILPKLTEPRYPVSWALYTLSNILPMDPRSHFWGQVFYCALVTLISAERDHNHGFFPKKPDDREEEGFPVLSGQWLDNGLAGGDSYPRQGSVSEPQYGISTYLVLQK